MAFVGFLYTEKTDALLKNRVSVNQIWSWGILVFRKRVSFFHFTPEESKVTLIWWFFFANSSKGVDVCCEGLIDFKCSSLKATFPPAWDLWRKLREKMFYFCQKKTERRKTSQPSIFVINFSAQPKTVYLINLNLSEINWVLLLSFHLAFRNVPGKTFLPGEGINAF